MTIRTLTTTVALLANLALFGACDGAGSMPETKSLPVVTDGGETAGSVDIIRDGSEVTVDITLNAGWDLERLSIFGPDGDLLSEDDDYTAAIHIGAAERVLLDFDIDLHKEGEGATSASVDEGEGESAPGFEKWNGGDDEPPQGEGDEESPDVPEAGGEDEKGSDLPEGEGEGDDEGCTKEWGDDDDDDDDDDGCSDDD